MAQEKYLQFPITFLKDILNNKEQGLINIRNYGLWWYIKYKHNQRLKENTAFVTDKEAAVQILYCNYREILPEEIEDELSEYEFEYIGQDYDYNGFNGTSFEPENELIELLDTFESNRHLKDLCIKYVATRKAFLAHFNRKEHIEQVFDYGQSIDSRIETKTPFCSINVNVLDNYLHNEKTDFEIEQLLCFLALNSILRTKPFYTSNWRRLLARMLGYKEEANIPSKLNKQQQGIFDKYSKRHHRDKMFKALENNWNLYFDKSVKRRGFAFSMEKDFEKLDEHIFKKSPEYKKAVRESRQQKNRQRLLDELKNNNNNEDSLPF